MPARAAGRWVLCTHVHVWMVRVEARACVGHLLVSPALEMSRPHYPVLHRNTAHSTGQLTDRVVPVRGKGWGGLMVMFTLADTHMTVAIKLN